MNKELIFGPLEIKGDFSYDISEVSEPNKEIFDYIKSIYNEYKQFDKNKINVSEMFENIFFNRVIKLDLGHINPIIGLLIINITNETYNIKHISIHKSFRNQGLGKLMLKSFANYIKNEVKNPTIFIITFVIPNYMNDLIEAFRKIKFNEMKIKNDYHMIKYVDKFIETINYEKKYEIKENGIIFI